MLGDGVKPAMLLSEHLPFDLIAVSPDGQLSRLSVKYRAVVSDLIVVNMSSCWADKHGVHRTRANKRAFDAVAVYCPTSRSVYYLRVHEFATNVHSVSLRLAPARNGQTCGVRMAADFLGAARLFMPRT